LIIVIYEEKLGYITEQKNKVVVHFATLILFDDNWKELRSEFIVV